MSDLLLTCPFDPQHKVRSSRFEIHLSKCQKHHPSKLVMCPFNAKHVLTSYAKYMAHLAECPDNERLFYEAELNKIMDEQRLNSQLLPTVDLSRIETEDWDSEITQKKTDSQLTPSLSFCYATMTPKQRREFTKKEIEEFEKKKQKPQSTQPSK